MPRREFVAKAAATSSAPPEAVYDLVSDAEKWASWGGPLAPKSGWERRGEPDPAGVGAVRKVGMWPVWVREETIGAERGRRHEYTLRSGAPLKDYRGEVLLTPRTDGGTDIAWTVWFTELVPGSGKVVHLGVRQLVRALSRRLARGAERA